MINFKNILILYILFLLGCSDELKIDKDPSLLPADLGMKKILLTAAFSPDEIAVMKFSSPVVPPTEMEVLPATHEWVKCKYSKTGKVSFSIIMMQGQFFRMISQSLQRTSSIPTHGVTIDGDEFIVIPNSVISSFETDNQNLSISLEELDPQNLSVKKQFTIKCSISVIKRTEALKIYSEATKDLDSETEEWSALHKIN